MELERPRSQTPPKPTLRRELGLLSLTAVVVGEVIAVGIFLTPAQITNLLASPIWVLVIWSALGAMTLCGALTFGELSARLPETGGLYIYLREAFGPRMAFLYGWMSLVIMDPGLTAALALGLGSYAAYLFGWGPAGVKAVAILVILALAASHSLSSALGSALVRSLTLLKIGLIAFIVVWGLALGLGSWSHFVPFAARHAAAAPLPAALAGALVAGFFSFGGWWDTSKLAGEARNPARDMPRAMILGVSIVTLVYVTLSAVFIYLVPIGRAASDTAFAGLVGEILFGPVGGSILSIVVIASVLGSLTGILLAAPRVYCAMGVDGLFIPRLAAVHPRTGTPLAATLVQAGLSCVMVAWSGFAQIIAYFIFVAVAFVGLTAVSLFVFRSRSPLTPGFRCPGYPWTPAAFLLMVCAMLVLLFVDNPLRSLAGIGIVLLGLPAFRLVKGRRKHDLDSDDSLQRSGREAAPGDGRPAQDLSA